MGKFMGHDDRERNFEKALQRHLRQGASRAAGAAANSQAEPASPACPDPAMLSAFHERMLSNEEMDAAKAHIAACSRCQEILALLEATDEVVSDVVTDAEREKVFELGEPVLAGSPSQEEEILQYAAAPAAAARPAAAWKAPQSISTGRRARMWRWVAPAAAVAAGLLIWVTTHDKLRHPISSMTNLEVAQEKSERQLDARSLPVPPATLSAQNGENGRLDDALKSLNESKGSAGALSARRAPARTLGGAGGGVAGTPAEQTRRELPLRGRNSFALKALAPAKPSGTAATQGAASAPAASPSVDTNAAELDKATAKDRKKTDSPVTPANAPASTVGGNAAAVAGGQNARDSGRKIQDKQKLEPGVAGELSASSAPTPQPAAPPPAAARTAAKQSAVAAEKKEAGANAMTVTTEQAQVTANYESAASLQNDKAGLAKISEARTNNLKTKDATPILTPGGTVLWRLRAGGKIERSADRGITWSQQNSGVRLELLAGSAPSDAVCWLVGRAGTILRTTDGGGHWSKVVSPLTGDVGGIRAEDALHAVIFDAGNNARFITSDGGATWAPAKE